MKKAFTLIELLIVIIIIGILSSLAIPQYTNMVERARFAQGVSMLGSLKGAEEGYKAETGGYYFFGWSAAVGSGYTAPRPDNTMIVTINTDKFFDYSCYTYIATPAPPASVGTHPILMAYRLANNSYGVFLLLDLINNELWLYNNSTGWKKLV